MVMANRKSICNLIGVDETFQLFFLVSVLIEFDLLAPQPNGVGDEEEVVVVGDYHNDDDDDGQGTDATYSGAIVFLFLSTPTHIVSLSTSLHDTL